MLHVDKNSSHVKIISSRVDIIMLLVDITCPDHEGQQNAPIEIIILCVTVNFFQKENLVFCSPKIWRTTLHNSTCKPIAIALNDSVDLKLVSNTSLKMFQN